MTETFDKILLVVPLYNHGATVRPVVEAGLAAGWQVLVVDDGSTDDGLAGVVGLDCLTLRLEQNQGKGAAILAGARMARERGFESIITVDADGQLNPAEAGRLASVAEGKGPVMVIGNRRMEGDSIPRASLFGRAFSNFWVRLESGHDLPDTQSGFRLYPVRELLELPVRCRRYDFEVEVITRAAWAGIPVVSVPVSVHYPAPEERLSHFDQFRDNLRLTCLHTGLVLRALLPWPHRRLREEAGVEGDGASDKTAVSMLHPVRLMKRLCREHTSTINLAAAAWLGIFLGALPLLACHTVAILYVCHRLHLNKLAAVAASQLCAPPLLPVICLQTGYLLRHGSFLTELSWDTMVTQAHYRLWEWFLGSLVIGPLFGVMVGGLFYLVLNKLRSGKTAGESGEIPLTER